jgi:16S rRNA (uracil1498-N3)-methyltransferase
MQRYFISPEQVKLPHVRILGDDVHHIKNVLRGRPGEKLICCDGQGRDYVSEIDEISRDEVVCRVLETVPSKGEPRTRVTVAQSLPKGDKLEWILQKGTEIGAVRFLPFTSERTVVKIEEKKSEKKRERWQRIVKEAAEQAHRGRIPEVSSPISWDGLLEEIRQVEAAYIAYEKGGDVLSRRLEQDAPASVLLIVGPEGGFSDREVREAMEAGAVPVTLGPRILRTETAPLVALSCILFALEDLGGETE